MSNLVALAILAMSEFSGLPRSPSTWECTVRCYAVDTQAPASWRWLHDKNQAFLVCTTTPDAIQTHLDRQCDAMYGRTLPAHSAARGYLNWPASPGSLVACKNVGNKCTTPGVVKSNWSCPATCRGGGRTAPTIFNICSVSEYYAYHDGLELFKTTGEHPLCAPGMTLGAPEASEPFNNPPFLLCKSTQKECEL